MLTLHPPDEMLGAIPDLQTLRVTIGTRAEELTILRRLLKLAEAKVRLQSRAAAPPPTDPEPAHAAR